MNPGPLTLCLALAVGDVLAAPASAAPTPAELALVNRVTWGVNADSAAAIARMGADRWLERQLHPSADDRLPPPVAAEIQAMPMLQTPLIGLVMGAEQQRKEAVALTDPDAKKAALDDYNKALNAAARQAINRSILRDIYSQNQLQEQMTWFWFNHFNVHASKANLRVMVGDYEDRALRPHALGRFRDLLEATLRHPAMLRYLDNAENAAGRINENYAREIMELHTMGVGSGYSQKDVQELARILTGVGIDARPLPPRIGPAHTGDLIRDGIFEFNPNRHDYGDKIFLGHVIRGRGFGEAEEALDILAAQPATARHISKELAIYFVSDDPPESLVRPMAAMFEASHGDIAKVLRVMFHSPEFRASLGTKFKDPAHYVISALRLTYHDTPIENAAPAQGWMNRLAEGLYGHETPDGYPMIAAAWNGPGQMETRFEVARAIASGGGGLYKPAGPGAVDRPARPALQPIVNDEGLAAGLAGPTRAALSQAVSPADWNTLYLSSPDFMRR